MIEAITTILMVCQAAGLQMDCHVLFKKCRTGIESDRFLSAEDKDRICMHALRKVVLEVLSENK